MQTLDLSRWRGTPRGLAYRRWTIVSSGMRLLLRTRLFKILVGLGWVGGLLIALLGFAYSQALAPGGWLETLASKLGPRTEAIVSGFVGLVTLFPDVCLGGVFTLLLWLHSFVGQLLTLVALTVLIPQLITRDRVSNALTIYLSHPLTTTDYLLGKLGVIVSTIGLVWTGPLLVGWAVSMLFATDTDFLRYSLAPLGRALLFNGIALTALSAIALGVSALAGTARTATVLWVGLWLILAGLAAPPPGPVWLKRASFTHNLGQVRQQVFRLDDSLVTAARSLPLLDPHVAASLERAGERAQPGDFRGALGSLGVLTLLSSIVFLRRLRPES